MRSSWQQLMFGRKGIITLPSIEPCTPSVIQDVIHFAPTSWDDRREVIGVCALEYLSILSWPRARAVASPCHQVMNLPWKWCRIQSWSMYGIFLCSSCGWLTGQLSIDHHLCTECHNIGVCERCHYVDARGQYRCIQCEPMLSPHQNNISLTTLIDRFQLYDKIDEFQGSGYYHRAIDSTLMRLIMKEWCSLTWKPRVRERVAGFALSTDLTMSWH